MSDSTGRFVWYELMTTDTNAAKTFYPKVAGWKVEPWQGPMEYSMFVAGGKPIAGLMTLPDEAKQMGAPPHWMGYVAVADVDASVARAAELGATIFVPPTDIPGVGRFAIFADPQHAALALFKGQQDMPVTDDTPKMGEFSWHELATTDMDAAWTFYSTLFGWEKTEAMDMGGGMMYQMYAAKGSKKTLGGIYNKPPTMPAPPHWLYYVTVPDINEAVDALKANGGQVLNGPMDVPGGDVIAQVMDPQGVAFAFHSRARQAG